MIDLATLFSDNEDENEPDRKVDLSGKPVPKNVRAVIDSGLEIQCEVAYDGTVQEGTKYWRRYQVKAEIDWTKHWITTLIIGVHPIDVRLILDLPEANRKDALQFKHQMQVITEQSV